MKNKIFFITSFILVSFTSNAQNWSITGNVGTNPLGVTNPSIATNYIGTTDNKPLIFKTNNTFSGILGSNGITSFGLNSCQDGRGYNTAFGENSLRNNSYTASGGNNTAFGYSTLMNNTIGKSNVAVGHNALYSNVFANENVAIGANALFSNIGEVGTNNGEFNVAIGSSALRSNTIGQGNIALGRFTLSANQIGNGNIGIGGSVLSKATGSGNVAIGGGGFVTTGQYNTLIGNASGSNNSIGLTTGNYNCFIGQGSGQSVTTGSNNTIIGVVTALPNSTSNTTLLGNPTSGIGLTIVNYNAGFGSKFRLTPGISPANTLEISNGTPNNSGLTFTNLTSTNTPVATAFDGVLSVDITGKVILVKDKQSTGISNTCIVSNFVPKTIGTVGNLTCSQIFDGPVTSTNSAVTGNGIGINTTATGNRLEIKHGTPNNSGLRFTNLTIESEPKENESKNVLSLNQFGDVIWVKDQLGSTLQSNCTNLNFLPKTNTVTGDLGCSQIFDGPVTSINPAVTGNGIGINTTAAGNRLEIKHGTPNNSGLRFTNLNSNSLGTDVITDKVLTVNEFGDVVLVLDRIGSNLQNTCSNNNFITKTNTVGNLICSSIYDDGAGHVGFGFGSIPNTAVNVSINGSSATFGGSYNVSDVKFKKNIRNIDNPLEKIMNLEGKTYNWREDEFKNINFNDQLQYGLIAQEVQKVLPSLVLQSDNGDLAMNYIALIPILIEGIKEQQTQIIALNNQIADLVSKGILDENKITDGKTYFSSNYPNPFETITKIDYFIYKTVKEAQIMVYDINGTTISKHDLKERGIPASITINKGGLKTGIYFYTLITDGTVIGTKRMIVK